MPLPRRKIKLLVYRSVRYGIISRFFKYTLSAIDGLLLNKLFVCQVIQKYMTAIEAVYDRYLSKALSFYYSDSDFVKCYGRVPKQRHVTFKHCLEHLKSKKTSVNIVELGTCRSFVDGRFPGVLSSDAKWWDPRAPEKWDWSAGLFSKYYSDLLSSSGVEYKITTVDISRDALNVCKTITQDNKSRMSYVECSSEQFIQGCPEKSVDLLYLDTGNMDEGTAQLHLREAKLLVERQVIKDDGLILVDDVMNPGMLLSSGETNKLGKSKYALPYMLKNGYKEVISEYQVVLKKI